MIRFSSIARRTELKRLGRSLFTAHADPASEWTAARKGPAFVAYSDNYLVDTDHGIILDVEATRSIRQAEVGAMRRMIDRTEERFGLKPEWVAADTAYGASEKLVWLTLKRQIHLPGRQRAQTYAPQLFRPRKARIWIESA